MTADETERVVAEAERLWRERTPARRADEVLASYRVGRGEVRLWCKQQGIHLDEMDEDFQVAMLKMYCRLRREFPGERWDVYTAATKELAKRCGVVLPRVRQPMPESGLWHKEGEQHGS